MADSSTATLQDNDDERVPTEIGNEEDIVTRIVTGRVTLSKAKLMQVLHSGFAVRYEDRAEARLAKGVRTELEKLSRAVMHVHGMVGNAIPHDEVMKAVFGSNTQLVGKYERMLISLTTTDVAFSASPLVLCTPNLFPAIRTFYANNRHITPGHDHFELEALNDDGSLAVSHTEAFEQMVDHFQSSPQSFFAVIGASLERAQRLILEHQPIPYADVLEPSAQKHKLGTLYVAGVLAYIVNEHRASPHGMLMLALKFRKSIASPSVHDWFTSREGASGNPLALSHRVCGLMSSHPERRFAGLAHMTAGFMQIFKQNVSSGIVHLVDLLSENIGRGTQARVFLKMAQQCENVGKPFFDMLCERRTNKPLSGEELSALPQDTTALLSTAAAIYYVSNKIYCHTLAAYVKQQHPDRERVVEGLRAHTAAAVGVLSHMDSVVRRVEEVLQKMGVEFWKNAFNWSKVPPSVQLRCATTADEPDAAKLLEQAKSYTKANVVSNEKENRSCVAASTEMPCEVSYATMERTKEFLPCMEDPLFSAFCAVYVLFNSHMFVECTEKPELVEKMNSDICAFVAPSDGSTATPTDKDNGGEDAIAPITEDDAREESEPRDKTLYIDANDFALKSAKLQQCDQTARLVSFLAHHTSELYDMLLNNETMRHAAALFGLPISRPWMKRTHSRATFRISARSPSVFFDPDNHLHIFNSMRNILACAPFFMNSQLCVYVTSVKPDPATITTLLRLVPDWIECRETAFVRSIVPDMFTSGNK